MIIVETWDGLYTYASGEAFVVGEWRLDVKDGDGNLLAAHNNWIRVSREEPTLIARMRDEYADALVRAQGVAG